MDREGRPILEVGTVWPLVHEAAMREQGQMFESRRFHAHYRISRVESSKIVVDRLDGGQQATLTEYRVRRAITDLNEAAGWKPRQQLFGTVAMEVTLVHLLPSILRWSDDDSRIEVIANEEIFPDEVDTPETFTEGATKRVSVNVYERNPMARAKCIAHYGSGCRICGINFGEVYGSIGDGFIHVHHLKRLSEIGEAYEVDPIADLCPVCPNCHAMLHRTRPPLSIEEMKSRLRGATGRAPP